VPWRGSGGGSGGLCQSTLLEAVVAAGRIGMAGDRASWQDRRRRGVGDCEVQRELGRGSFLFFNFVLPAFEPCSLVCALKCEEGTEKASITSNRSPRIWFTYFSALILMKTNFYVYNDWKLTAGTFSWGD
jgi:hypothetical protein